MYVSASVCARVCDIYTRTYTNADTNTRILKHMQSLKYTILCKIYKLCKICVKVL